MFPRLSGASLSGQPLSLPPRGLVALILVSLRGLGMVSVCVCFLSCPPLAHTHCNCHSKSIIINETFGVSFDFWCFL